MKEYNFTETDLFIQTAYFTLLKEKRKVIDIEDISRYNEVIKDLYDKQGDKINYYQIKDEDITIEDYFKKDGYKYILLPWYDLVDIEFEIPEEILNKKEEILNKIPAKEEQTKEDYENLYQSLKQEIENKYSDINYLGKQKQ